MPVETPEEAHNHAVQPQDSLSPKIEDSSKQVAHYDTRHLNRWAEKGNISNCSQYQSEMAICSY
jgi:hypothetical protein